MLKISKVISAMIAGIFLSTTICPPEVSAQSLNLPSQALGTTPSFQPVKLSGIKIFPKEPFRFDFILDQGDQTNLGENEVHDESMRLIKYFMASLTVPEGDLWVNLSPYEKDRIIPDALGQTDMGKDLLVQDYMLKQLTSSLMHPEGEVGQEFWSTIYSKAYEKLGTVDIPVDTFNKVWIVPDQIEVYQNMDVAYVTNANMKVMLEEDYLSREHAVIERTDQDFTEETKSIIRDVILPVIEQEVNEGEHFAPLRQILNSMILAKWYEQHFKNSVIGQKYVDQKKIDGIELENKNVKFEIYDRYVNAFKQGVYDVLKEEYDPVSQKLIPKKYFSGGVLVNFDRAQMSTNFDHKINLESLYIIQNNFLTSFFIQDKASLTRREFLLTAFLFAFIEPLLRWLGLDTIYAQNYVFNDTDNKELIFEYLSVLSKDKRALVEKYLDLDFYAAKGILKHPMVPYNNRYYVFRQIVAFVSEWKYDLGILKSLLPVIEKNFLYVNTVGDIFQVIPVSTEQTVIEYFERLDQLSLDHEPLWEDTKVGKYDDEINRWKHFFGGLYILTEAVRAQVIPQYDAEQVFRDLVSVESLQGYEQWVHSSFVPIIRKRFEQVKQLSPKRLQVMDDLEILKLSIVGLDFSESEMLKIQDFLDSQNLDMTNWGDIFMGLAYAKNIRFFSDKAFEKVDSTLVNDHVWYMDPFSNMWTGATVAYPSNISNVKSQKVIGTPIALSGELSHLYSFVLKSNDEGYVYHSWAGDYNYEIDHFIGWVFMNRPGYIPFFNEALDYVYLHIEMAKEILTTNALKSLVWGDVLTKSQIDFVEKGDGQALVDSLSISQIYFLGKLNRHLVQESKYLEKIISLEKRVRSKGINQNQWEWILNHSVGIMSLNLFKPGSVFDMGFSLRDDVVPAYDQIKKGHAQARRISSDFNIHLIHLLKENDIFLSSNAFSYLQSLAFEYVSDRFQEPGDLYWEQPIEVIQLISLDEVEKWLKIIQKKGISINQRNISKNKIKDFFGDKAMMDPVRRVVVKSLFSVLLFLLFPTPANKARIQKILNQNFLEEKFLDQNVPVQKFIPKKKDQRLLIVGQDKESMERYVDSYGVPGGFMTYTSLNHLKGLVGSFKMGKINHEIKPFMGRHPNTVLNIGLDLMNGQVDQVIERQLDDKIQQLGLWIKSAQRPVYLRIGYEFDYPGNNYSPDTFIEAYQTIVDQLRKQGVDNVAFVWNSVGWWAGDWAKDHGEYNPKKWYPGDEYVDIFAVNFLGGTDQTQARQTFASFAKEREKPLMIGEASPIQNSSTTVTQWWQSLKRFMDQYDVRIVSYISWDWKDKLGYDDWGDANIDQLKEFSQVWQKDVVENGNFLKSSEALFKSLDGEDNAQLFKSEYFAYDSQNWQGKEMRFSALYKKFFLGLVNPDHSDVPVDWRADEGVSLVAFIDGLKNNSVLQKIKEEFETDDLLKDKIEFMDEDKLHFTIAGGYQEGDLENVQRQLSDVKPFKIQVKGIWMPSFMSGRIFLKVMVESDDENQTSYGSTIRNKLGKSDSDFKTFPIGWIQFKEELNAKETVRLNELLDKYSDELIEEREVTQFSFGHHQDSFLRGWDEIQQIGLNHFGAVFSLNGGKIEFVSLAQQMSLNPIGKGLVPLAELPEEVKNSGSKVGYLRLQSIFELRLNEQNQDKVFAFVERDTKHFEQYQDEWSEADTARKVEMSQDWKDVNFENNTYQGPPRFLLVPYEEAINYPNEITQNKDGFYFADTIYSTLRNSFQNINMDIFEGLVDEDYIRFNISSLGRVVLEKDNQKYILLQLHTGHLESGIVGYKPIGGQMDAKGSFFDDSWYKEQNLVLEQSLEQKENVKFFVQRKFYENFMRVYQISLKSRNFQYFESGFEIFYREIIEELTGFNLDGSQAKDGIALLSVDDLELQNLTMMDKKIYDNFILSKKINFPISSLFSSFFHAVYNWNTSLNIPLRLSDHDILLLMSFSPTLLFVFVGFLDPSISNILLQLFFMFGVFLLGKGHIEEVKDIRWIRKGLNSYNQTHQENISFNDTVLKEIKTFEEETGWLVKWTDHKNLLAYPDINLKQLILNIGFVVTGENLEEERRLKYLKFLLKRIRVHKEFRSRGKEVDNSSLSQSQGLKKVGGIDLNNVNIQKSGNIVPMEIDPAMMNIQIPTLIPQIISIRKFEDEAQLAEFLNMDDLPIESSDPTEGDWNDFYARNELFVEEV